MWASQIIKHLLWSTPHFNTAAYGSSFTFYLDQIWKIWKSEGQVWRTGLRLTDSLWDVNLNCYLAGQTFVCGGTEKKKAEKVHTRSGSENGSWVNNFFAFAFLKIKTECIVPSFLSCGLELSRATCLILLVYCYIILSEPLQCI